MNSVFATGSVRHLLRDATAPRHASVDAQFGALNLSRRDDYVALLRAHARALPPLESAADGAALYPPWQARTPLLQADLAMMDEAMPEPLRPAQPLTPGGALQAIAARWGLLYVLEGSKLGGAMLARSVPASYPRAYLSAAHAPGAWRAFQEALDRAAGDAAWIDEAAQAANRAFLLFEAAAQ